MNTNSTPRSPTRLLRRVFSEEVDSLGNDVALPAHVGSPLASAQDGPRGLASLPCDDEDEDVENRDGDSDSSDDDEEEGPDVEEGQEDVLEVDTQAFSISVKDSGSPTADMHSFTFHLWDFNSKQIFQDVHRLFLATASPRRTISPVVVLVTWDISRVYVRGSLRFWLQSVRRWAPKARVFLVSAFATVSYVNPV